MTMMFAWQDIVQGAPLLFSGLLMTVLLAVIVLPLAVVMGTLLGVLRHRGVFLFQKGAVVYVEFVRSVPLILFLVFIHYGLLPLLGIRPHFLMSSVLAFVLFESAYFAEIVRGGLRSLHVEEHEAAISLGLSRMQQLLLVDLPLAFQRTIPALVNQAISLIKDTSLASIVGVIELTRAGEIIYEQTYHDFEILLIQALIYFAICFSLSRLSQRYESRLDAQESLSLQSA